MTSEPIWPDQVFANLDRSGPVPLYFQVATRLERAIQTGAIPPGARLENEISIADRLGLSRPTVRRAIQVLVDKGLLVRRRGIGTQVVQAQLTRPVELTSLFDDLLRMGHTPTTRVLTVERVAADAETARQLGVAPATEVARVRRLRYADGRPMAILDNVLAPGVVDASIAELESRGLYDLLRARGVTIKVANQRIGARRAHADEHELLDVAKGSPLLTMHRVAFDQDGRVVEAGHHCYRPDVYSFETTLVSR